MSRFVGVIRAKTGFYLAYPVTLTVSASAPAPSAKNSLSAELALYSCQDQISAFAAFVGSYYVHLYCVHLYYVQYTTYQP